MGRDLGRDDPRNDLIEQPLAKKPTVSVLMSVYNGERCVPEAIESILHQTFPDFEFIVIDDGSTDSTWQVLTAYAAQDSRIMLVRNGRNVGLTRSLNRGLALAEGKYVARQDADDVSLPERLSCQIRFLEEHPEVGAVGSAVKLIDAKGRAYLDVYSPIDHETLCASLLFDNDLCHTTLVVRSRLLRTLGGYDPDLPYAQDYDLWWRLSNISQIRALPVVLACKGTGSRDTIGIQRRLEQQRCALQVAVRAVRHVLAGQSFDEEAYGRFWQAYHGQVDKIHRGDVERLQPLWESLASQLPVRGVLGPKLVEFAARLFYSRSHECVHVLRIATRHFGQALVAPRTVKSLMKPLVPWPVLRVGRYLKAALGHRRLGPRRER